MIRKGSFYNLSSIGRAIKDELKKNTKIPLMFEPKIQKLVVFQWYLFNSSIDFSKILKESFLDQARFSLEVSTWFVQPFREKREFE